MWLCGWRKQRDSENTEEELCLSSTLLSVHSLSAGMVLHSFPLSERLSPSPWISLMAGGRPRDTEGQREREKGGGDWWLKAAPGSIHMQMAQGASTNPWEEKDYNPHPPPPPASNGWAASQCGTEMVIKAIGSIHLPVFITFSPISTFDFWLCRIFGTVLPSELMWMLKVSDF